MDYLVYLLVTLFGLIVGTLSGMFGIGGGAMIVPLLNLVFQLPMLNASATSLMTIAPTSISGSYRHLRQRTVDVPTALAFGIPGAVTSACSAILSGYLDDWIILVAAISVISFCAFRVFKEAFKKPIDDSGRTSELRFKNPTSTLLASAAIGALAGFIAGVVGVGGGFIIVPFGIAMLGKTMKEMSAISLLAIAIISIPGIISHALFEHIYYAYGLALIIGTIPGAMFGVWLIARVKEKALRIAYGCVLVFSGCLLILNRLVFGG